MITRLVLAALLVSSLASAQQATVCQPGPGYAACSRAAATANISTLQRQRLVDAERVEAGKLSRDLMAEAQHPELRVKMSNDALAGYVATVRAREARINAIMIDLGHKPVDPTAFGDSAAAEVAKEQACRADSVCMAGRQTAALVKTICINLNEIRTMQERIRIERANPSGVVDLVELHDDGEIIQRDQAIVDASKASYVKIAKKAFDSSVCR